MVLDLFEEVWRRHLRGPDLPPSGRSRIEVACMAASLICEWLAISFFLFGCSPPEVQVDCRRGTLSGPAEEAIEFYRQVCGEDPRNLPAGQRR